MESDYELSVSEGEFGSLPVRVEIRDHVQARRVEELRFRRDAFITGTVRCPLREVRVFRLRQSCQLPVRGAAAPVPPGVVSENLVGPSTPQRDVRLPCLEPKDARLLSSAEEAVNALSVYGGGGEEEAADTHPPDTAGVPDVHGLP